MAKIIVDVNEIFGWGINTSGELGTGNSTSFNNVTQLQINDIDKVFVNGNNTTGYLKNNGDLWMSGSNSIGQFGNNSDTGNNSPIQIPGKFICVVGNNIFSKTNLFLKQDNTLWASGCNSHGQLGQSDIINRSSMVQIPGTWISIGNGQYSSFGIKSDCTLWAWGENGTGGLGNNSVINRSSPVQIPGTWICALQGADVYTTFGIKSDCTLWVWGRNDCGLFGLSYSTSCAISSPTQIPGNWASVSVGRNHVTAIKSNCTLWVWGRNGVGEVGDNSIIDRSSPVQILGTWICINSGFNQTLGLKSDCTLWIWGAAPNNTIPARSISSPVQILGNYTYISTGCRNSMVMTKFSKEYNKNDNGGVWNLQGIYDQKISDKWSDFIPTIDD